MLRIVVVSYQHFLSGSFSENIVTTFSEYLRNGTATPSNLYYSTFDATLQNFWCNAVRLSIHVTELLM